MTSLRHVVVSPPAAKTLSGTGFTHCFHHWRDGPPIPSRRITATNSHAQRQRHRDLHDALVGDGSQARRLAASGPSGERLIFHVLSLQQPSPPRYPLGE
jgi:hypothetical protein